MVVFRILPSKYLHFIELSYLAYFMPLFFTNVKFELHIYYQKIILILKKNKSIEISCCHIQENEMLTRILTKRTVFKFDVNFVFGV